MEASEYAKIINQITVFKGLSPKNLERLIGVCTRETFKEGELALKSNDDAKEFYIVLVGRLAVLGPDEETLALVDPGQCVGEMAIFTKRRRSADVKAILDTEVLKILKDDLFQFVEDEPVAGNILYRNVIEVLSNHMEKNNLLMEFTHILEG